MYDQRLGFAGQRLVEYGPRPRRSYCSHHVVGRCEAFEAYGRPRTSVDAVRDRDAVRRLLPSRRHAGFEPAFVVQHALQPIAVALPLGEIEFVATFEADDPPQSILGSAQVALERHGGNPRPLARCACDGAGTGRRPEGDVVTELVRLKILVVRYVSKIESRNRRIIENPRLGSAIAQAL